MWLPKSLSGDLQGSVSENLILDLVRTSLNAASQNPAPTGFRKIRWERGERSSGSALALLLLVLLLLLLLLLLVLLLLGPAACIPFSAACSVAACSTAACLAACSTPFSAACSAASSAACSAAQEEPKSIRR